MGRISTPSGRVLANSMIAVSTFFVSWIVSKPGDFVISVLVLFAKVMKADGKLLKTELDYVKRFLKQQFGTEQTRELIVVFKNILSQEYPLKDVCRQIQRSMD